MPILDEYGRPVDTGRLTEKQSAPKLAGVRNYPGRQGSRIRDDAEKAGIDPASRPNSAIPTGVSS